ncbi:MAG: hypothetical protein QOD77_144 [Thermoplasmata archaeon]|nr:hypothetical protein [Thermoplasmata archaeon]
MQKAVRAAEKGPTEVAEEAVAHAEEQVHRAVTISHYEQILDAALRNLDPDLFFPEILGRIRTMLDADAATVFLLEADGRQLFARASSGLEDAVTAGIRIPMGEGVAGVALATRETQTVDDVNEKTVANPLLLSRGIQRLVTVPILAGDKPLGVLEVGWATRRGFDEQEKRLLEVVAEQVGMAVERARVAPLDKTESGSTRRRLVQPIIDEEQALAVALRKAAKEGDAEAMVNLAQAHVEQQTKAATTVGDYEAMRDAALGALPMDERLALLLEGTRTLLASDVAAILLMDDEGDQLWPRASLGFATSLGVRPVSVSGSIRKIVETGEPVLVSDVQPDDIFRIGLAEEGIQSLVAVPLRIQDKVQGVLVCGARSRDRFAVKDLELLQLVADRMGAGLQRGRLLESHVREKRKALLASQFKTDLLNMATHDIKTPLSALSLQIHMMTTVPMSEEERNRSMAIMQRNVKRLTTMLDDFLDLARVEAGRMTIKPGKIEVGRLLQDAVETFEAQAQQRRLKLGSQLEGRLEAFGDERRILQVITNLVSNAVRYAPAGSTIRLGARESPEHVEIYVQDEGLGLTPEQIARLFRPFSQVQGVAEESKGTGLGLYLSKAIVDAHGGKLTLTSAGKGKGVTAAFTLPKATAPAQAGP